MPTLFFLLATYSLSAQLPRWAQSYKCSHLAGYTVLLCTKGLSARQGQITCYSLTRGGDPAGISGEAWKGGRATSISITRFWLIRGGGEVVVVLQYMHKECVVRASFVYPSLRVFDSMGQTYHMGICI